MYIIAKYFNSVEDYINLLKTCKEYKNVIDLIKYNPIDIIDFNVFKNIETIHIYNSSVIPIYNAPTIIWYDVSYSTVRKNKNKNFTYKNIYITKSDANKYFNFNDINLFNFSIHSLLNYSFENLRIEKIILPIRITNIKNGAFINCRLLKIINLNELINLIEIGNVCFCNCVNLEYLNKSCNKNNDLSNLTLLNKIGDKCFKNCYKLKNVILHKNINTNNINKEILKL